MPLPSSYWEYTGGNGGNGYRTFPGVGYPSVDLLQNTGATYSTGGGGSTNQVGLGGGNEKQYCSAGGGGWGASGGGINYQGAGGKAIDLGGYSVTVTQNAGSNLWGAVA